MIRLRRALAIGLLAAVALAGCESNEDNPDSAGAASTSTTRVEVVEGLGGKRGFDAAALYERLSPGVVTVISTFDGSASSLLNEDDGEGGQGSGFVLDGDGYIATNAHVVTTGEPPQSKRAREVFVEFADGNRVSAKIVGTDLNSDIALLKLDPKGLELTALQLGRSAGLGVGRPVAAIGSPFGERQSLSVGVVSATDRTIQSLTAFQIGNAIQTDAAINPGNSGGPLLDARGRVIGINSQIKSTSGGGEGVGFAVPVDTVRRSLRELREQGRVDYGYLGVTSQPLYPQLAERLDIPVSNGALVADVEDDSPADDAGLRAGDDEIEFQGQQQIPTGGDTILAVDGRKLTQASDLADLVSANDAGDEVDLTVIRDGDRRTVKVKLGQRPERAPRNP